MRYVDACVVRTVYRLRTRGSLQFVVYDAVADGLYEYRRSYINAPTCCSLPLCLRTRHEQLLPRHVVVGQAHMSAR
jgi:hypothetical protein